MANVFKTPEKISLRNRLFSLAEEALVKEGWQIERIARAGKSSVRRIIKGKLRKTVSIRTSQDAWIAFPRDKSGGAWGTLADVDYVVAASVDDRLTPRFAQIHLIPGDEMRKRFDRAFLARKNAGYSLPSGRGMWVSLYDRESVVPVTLVGAGAGLVYPPILKKELSSDEVASVTSAPDSDVDVSPEVPDEEPPLTISEAKRRLALSLGVTEADIKIVING